MRNIIHIYFSYGLSRIVRICRSLNLKLFKPDPMKFYNCILPIFARLLRRWKTANFCYIINGFRANSYFCQHCWTPRILGSVLLRWSNPVIIYLENCPEKKLRIFNRFRNYSVSVFTTRSVIVVNMFGRCFRSLLRYNYVRIRIDRDVASTSSAHG